MNRSLRQLIPALALTSVALVGLTGCGQDTGQDIGAPEAADGVAADDPTSTSGLETELLGGDVAPDGLDPSLAQWPAAGCGSRSVVSVDYGRMPTGYGTPEEAVENTPAAGLPDGVLTMAPASAVSSKGPGQVWVVDPESNEILAQVSVFRGPDGWFVDGVMTCS